MDIFNNITPVRINQLPYDIDGLCKYVLPCESGRLMASSKDGRPWKPWCTSNRSGHKGVRRRTTCKGSWKCNNVRCPFLINGKVNTVQFISKKGQTLCFVCENEAAKTECNAVKIWEFSEDKKSVTVFHHGLHKCTAVPRKQHKEIENDLKEAFMKNSTLKPSEASGNLLLSAIKDEDWQEIERVAETVADSQRIGAIKKQTKRNDLGHSFDALTSFKSFCAKRDEFYIYKMNNEELNGEMTYVFKCSSIQAQLALSMDYEGEGALKEQYCYSDAKHNRCTGVSSILIIVKFIHPVYIYY